MKLKRKLPFSLLFFLMICALGQSQEAKDFIENSIIIPKESQLYLHFIDSTKVEYAYDIKGKRDFITLRDTLFQSKREGLKIYIKPYNPLSFSHDSKLEVKIDPINQKASEALGEIIDIIGKFQRKTQDSIAAVDNKSKSDCFSAIQNNIDQIQENLKDDKVEKMKDLFSKLKNTSFSTKESVEESLEIVFPEIDSIEAHYKKIPSLVEDLDESIENFECSVISSNEVYQMKLLLALVKKDINEIHSNQEKRLNNLKKVRDLVSKAKKTAENNINKGVGWFYVVEEVESNKNKISNLSISFKNSGYKLDEGEIVEITPKTINKKTITVRRFQRFIPEVSIGTAYTFFDYQSYGTDTDSLGNQVVGEPIKESIKNLKISTMLNLVYQIENSNLHPFYQLGAGINSDIPTILTGFGFRTNFGGLKRIAFSGGIAMTWLPELDELEVGDQVGGTSEIEEDLKYEFAWPPKAYIGLQYNF